MAQYRYARNENGVLFNIETVTPDIRKTNNFYCIGCGCPMRAGLGKINEHYFAHNTPESQGACNPETYLHRLGKRLFINLYNKHKEEGSPFRIGIKRPSGCEKDICPYGFDDPCSGYIDDFLEILPRYNQCYEEEWDEGFKPDILLLDNSGERLYIEIAVTHPCSAEKLASNIPIIEFHVQTEDDLKVFNDESLTNADNELIDIHNISLPLVKHPPNCEDQIADAKNKFIKVHQKAVHSGSTLNIPYRIEYSCPHAQCPYLKEATCKKQAVQDWFNLAEKLPIVKDDSESFSPNVLLTNKAGAQLRVNFAFQFSNRFLFPDGIKTIQFLVDDILHDGQWRIRHYNTKKASNKMSCLSTEYMLCVLHKDGRLQIMNEDHLPQLHLAYTSIKSDLLDYVLIEPSSFFDKVNYHEDLEGRQLFKSLLYKALVAFFADRNLPIKNCFLCRNKTDNKFRKDNVGKPIYCFARRMQCNSTEAICCNRYDQDSMRLGTLLMWDFGRWHDAINEAYGVMRFTEQK